MFKQLGKFAPVAVLSCASVLASIGTAHATAITGPGGQVFATGGNVVVEVLGSSSAFDNEIDFFFDFPDTASSTFIGIANHVGTVDLGAAGFHFGLGDELVFGIWSPDRDGSLFLMGGTERNPDLKIHADVSAAAAGAGFVESWIVGFEDLFEGGDNDFNDAVIRISQTEMLHPVPEPVTLVMLGIGFAGFGVAGRRPKTHANRYI